MRAAHRQWCKRGRASSGAPALGSLGCGPAGVVLRCISCARAPPHFQPHSRPLCLALPIAYCRFPSLFTTHSQVYTLHHSPSPHPLRPSFRPFVRSEPPKLQRWPASISGVGNKNDHHHHNNNYDSPEHAYESNNNNSNNTVRMISGSLQKPNKPARRCAPSFQRAAAFTAKP